jgi:regulator of replication initiation timing
MGATETAKEVVRIATTAGLAKDVIDLLEKKASLLAEQVTALEKENTSLLRENRNLTIENTQLRTQLPTARPKSDRLDETTAKMLKFFFDRAQDTSEEQLASIFKMQMGVIGYHTDILLKKRLIQQTVMGISSIMGSSPAMFCITSEGRKHVVESGLTG